MREFRFALLTIVIVAFLAGNVFAQYWFQFGARSGNSASFNNGARVEIQTITPQNLTSGSLGFWVGEILSNGAFIQVGYLIENATGNYPAICTESGCTNYEEIKAGDAEWFYEYFPQILKAASLVLLDLMALPVQMGHFILMAFIL